MLVTDIPMNLGDTTSLLHPHFTHTLGEEKGKVSYAKSSLPETWCFLELIFAEVKCCLQYTWLFLIVQNRGFLGQQMQFPFNGNHYSEWEQGADTHKIFTSLWGWGAQGHKPGSSNLDVPCCILGRFIPCLLDPTDQILSKIGHLVHCGTFFLHSKYVQRKVTLSTPYTARLNIIIVIHVRSVGGILHGLNAFREMAEDVWKLKHLQGQRTQ